MKAIKSGLMIMMYLSPIAVIAANAPEQGKYDLLTKLQGDWVLSPAAQQEGNATKKGPAAKMIGTNKVAMRFQVIGKGSTVQENLLPGTKKEMATMYHCNSFEECSQVRATHYCAKQNQPELVARPSNDTGTIALACDMSTALCNSDDSHVHGIQHELSDNDNHLKTTYTIFMNGKKQKDSVYHFVRNQ